MLADTVDESYSPHKRFKIVCEKSDSEELTYYISSIKKPKNLATIFVQSELGNPPLSELIANWSKDDKFVVVNFGFLKTRRVLLYQLGKDGMFTEIHSIIPDVGMVQDVELKDFGVDTAVINRVDATCCYVGNWSKQSQIKIVVSIGCVDKNGNFPEYGALYIIQEIKNEVSLISKRLLTPDELRDAEKLVK
ncbi:hypothetical protein [Luteolibacter pohnpeiensis]|uniref:hypothetical protein n=1 Tax=Luteolibacter pohnpeiensis TaxID=454153 RepID=UPI0019060E44|nr:hypothetical protein [Luteolibacter pohnpeiensis]